MSGRSRVFILLLLIALGFCWLFQPYKLPFDNPNLASFVLQPLPYPVVFTSRSNLSAFIAVPEEGLGLQFPGRGLFQAEGCLRLITPSGRVQELTRGRELPGGGTLIDVLSPSVSPDGKRVLFAARKSAPDPGRFRIYQINLKDFSIKQLTGTNTDPGCVKLPPMRHDSMGAMLSNDLRIKTDFDDIDPIELADESGTLVFSSSREPDLGRDHSHRSMQIWSWKKNSSSPVPMTANRNADRWPWQLSSNIIAFSMWSRVREVISADGTEITAFSSKLNQLTSPTNQWMAMFLSSQGEHFGLLAKGPFSIFRPRALEDGKLIFMTLDKNGDMTRLGICPPGWVGDSPSSRPKTTPLVSTLSPVIFSRLTDPQGRNLRFATPTPFPENKILLSFSNAEAPNSFGLALLSTKAMEQQIPEMIFDDPEFVDGEPVVVLPRKIMPTVTSSGQELVVPSGQEDKGLIFATSLNYSAMENLPGQLTDLGGGPIFNPPPAGLIHQLRFFSSPRDRFDDPKIPRVITNHSPISKLNVIAESANGWVPAGTPTLLAAFDSQGKIASWTSNAKDSNGRQSTTLGFAGDHYSLINSGKKHFCVGCHPGHSGLTPIEHKHHETWHFNH